MTKDSRAYTPRVCRQVGLNLRLRMSPISFGGRTAILPRKGIVGDWKTHFSKEDEQFLAEELARYGMDRERRAV